MMLDRFELIMYWVLEHGWHVCESLENIPSELESINWNASGQAISL